MSEANAIETTGMGESAPASCRPDAKREADKMPASAAPPLAGRSLCRRCWGHGYYYRFDSNGGRDLPCPECQGTGEERSVPANDSISGTGGAAQRPAEAREQSIPD